MDVPQVHRQLARFISRHQSEFYELPKIQTQLLEVGATTIAAEHYRLRGYRVVAQNLIARRFRVKVTSRGHPWNYSWFSVERDGTSFEIHTNVAVSSSYGLDDERYVVDVGVTRPGWAANAKSQGKRWVSLPNSQLVTFIEAKKLVVYPMLLAQFLGIVHEISPRFLERLPRGFVPAGHFPPSLISTGHPAGTSRSIARGFATRGFRVAVVPSFDVRLSGMRQGQVSESPFDTDWL